MSQSALATHEEPQKHLKKIEAKLKKLDDLLKENFKLKREIACEKKRYLDLMNAFVEMRNEQKIREEEEEQLLSYDIADNGLETNNEDFEDEFQRTPMFSNKKDRSQIPKSASATKIPI